MPLIHDISPKAFKHNLKVELDAGKTHKEAVAIAFGVRKAIVREASKRQAEARTKTKAEERLQKRLASKDRSSPRSFNEQPSKKASISQPRLVRQEMGSGLAFVGSKAKGFSSRVLGLLRSSPRDARSNEPKASPRGSSLRLPRIQPKPLSQSEPFIQEARVIPRNVSAVLNKITPKFIRKRKDHD